VVLFSSGSRYGNVGKKKSEVFLGMLTFDDFWDAYPRKRAKADALKAWKKIAPAQAVCERILAAIADQARSKQWRDGFIPYPATWLRRHQWEDELTRADFYEARL
jgi:hypothetical protein